MFDIGQQVVCVDDEGELGHRWGLYRGRIYTVAWVKPLGAVCSAAAAIIGNDLMAVGLEEARHPCQLCGDGTDWGFEARRFRPLDDARLEVFREMLVTPPAAPVKVEELA